MEQNDPPKIGRPQIEVNWKAVDAMCMHQATQHEIACFLGVSEDTLSRACIRDHGISYAAYAEQKRLAGNVALRKLQWQYAAKGNPALLIFLGKQYLAQSDKMEVNQVKEMKFGGLPIPRLGTTDKSEPEADRVH